MWSDSSNEEQLFKDAAEMENRYTQSQICQTDSDTTVLRNIGNNGQQHNGVNINVEVDIDTKGSESDVCDNDIRPKTNQDAVQNDVVNNKSNIDGQNGASEKGIENVNTNTSDAVQHNVLMKSNAKGDQNIVTYNETTLKNTNIDTEEVSLKIQVQMGNNADDCDYVAPDNEIIESENTINDDDAVQPKVVIDHNVGNCLKGAHEGEISPEIENYIDQGEQWNELMDNNINDNQRNVTTGNTNSYDGDLQKNKVVDNKLDDRKNGACESEVTQINVSTNDAKGQQSAMTNTNFEGSQDDKCANDTTGNEGIDHDNKAQLNDVIGKSYRNSQIWESGNDISHGNTHCNLDTVHCNVVIDNNAEYCQNNACDKYTTPGKTNSDDAIKHNVLMDSNFDDNKNSLCDNENACENVGCNDNKVQGNKKRDDGENAFDNDNVPGPTGDNGVTVACDIPMDNAINVGVKGTYDDEFSPGITNKHSHSLQTNPDVTCNSQAQGNVSEAKQESIKSARKTRRKKKQTRQKLTYICSSSTDENIPLSMYVQKQAKVLFDVSDNDKTYVPASKDLNSTDTEFYSDVSENTLKDIDFMQSAKQLFKRSKKHKSTFKQKHSTRKQRKQQPDVGAASDNNESLQKAKDLSRVQSLVQNSIIKANEGRIDQVLNSNGLRRRRVPRHGNCFFDAVLLSGTISGTSLEMRQSLCNHLEEHAEEYMGFLLNTFNPENEESFIAMYLEEIESLKEEGYWSNKVADFLPLALANLFGRTVKIYTSKVEQQLIIIQPSLKNVCSSNKDEICLAYISVENVLEHYDACEKLGTTSSRLDIEHTDLSETLIQSNTQDEIFIARPASPEATCSRKSNMDTPRKEAIFVTPVKKKLTRKRKATPENWKRNIRKRLKLSGKDYVSATGKQVSKKSLKGCDCSKCRYKCSKKCSEEDREKIFDAYWAKGSYERQKDFICARVQEKKTKTFIDENGQTAMKKKMVTRIYTFEINGVNTRVCKKFFLKTLDIGEAYVVHALANKVAGHFDGNERRGKCQSANKTPDEMLDSVRQHIASFPTVAAHYIRKESKRQYLESNLTLTKMYDLYKDKCAQEEQTPVKLSMYRRIFNDEFNISFHVPKKDQCNLCAKYHVAAKDGVLTDKMKEEFKQHQRCKITAREEKQKDKNLAKEDSKVHACTFDLQSVLYTPCSLVSVMYYMRKLCCYNLSVYSLGNGNGSCFVWSEVNGKRGSCEISTCIHLYLQSLPQSVQNVVLYSDACTGQNRNQIMASSLLYAVNKIENIKQIDHKFLESGHTHMECDSMHAAIEFAKKRTQINVPSQWDTVISMARRNKPYTVIPIKYGDFLNFKHIKSTNVKTTHSDSGVKVNWTHMKWLRFTKSDPQACYFKYDMNDRDFERIKLTNEAQQSAKEPLPRLYKSKLPISSAKKKDLTTLCKRGIIPSEFHDYYKSLPTSSSAKEVLAEPDIEESDVDMDTE